MQLTLGFIVAPLVATGVTVAACAAVILLWIFGPWLIRIFLEGLRGIPYVGGWLANRAERIIHHAEAYFARLLQHQIEPLLKWLDALGNVLYAWASVLAQFSVEVGRDVIFMQTTRRYVPGAPGVQGLREAIPHEHRRIDDLRGTLFDKPDGWIWRLSSSLDGLVETLFDPKVGRITNLEKAHVQLRTALFDDEVGWIWRLGRSIDALASRTFDPETGAVPRISRSLDNLVDRLFDPKVGRITHLDTQTEQNRHNITALEAVTIPALAVATTIFNESGLNNPECRSKVNQACTTNPTAWGDMIGGLLGGFGLLAFPLMVEIASDIMGQMSEEIRKYAIDGPPDFGLS